ncbi:MAG: hypothetical protein HC827_14265 [Cyanobacteria bacterium RM1_2_2]|nr:hypothetical protein [Cyanobacteria bacterium RM1_2_2]
MAKSFGSSSPLQPMNVGSIVSAAFQLYRSHLKQYLSITWRATLWIFLALLCVMGPIVLLILSSAFEAALIGLIVLLIPVGIVLMVICSARAGMNTALISRLAYGELIQQPESVQAGRQDMRPRMWRLFWAQVFVNLLLWLINVGLTIVQSVFAGLAAVALGSESVIAGLITVIVYLVTLGIYLWFSARWAIPELPIAIENVSSSQAVTRSWDLSEGSAMRVLTVLFVALLVTLPLYILSFLPFFSTLITLAPQLAADSNVARISLVVSLGISTLLFLLLNIFIIPFWQALKALIYYDLRNRREGLDLQLRQRPD